MTLKSQKKKADIILRVSEKTKVSHLPYGVEGTSSSPLLLKKAVLFSKQITKHGRVEKFRIAVVNLIHWPIRYTFLLYGLGWSIS